MIDLLAISSHIVS